MRVNFSVFIWSAMLVVASVAQDGSATKESGIVAVPAEVKDAVVSGSSLTQGETSSPTAGVPQSTAKQPSQESGEESSPQKSLLLMQGQWKPQWTNQHKISPASQSEIEFWNHMQIADQLTIERSQLVSTGLKQNKSAAVALDFSASGFKSFREMNIVNGTLMMLTLENGTPVLASYNVSDSLLTFRYPAGCCSRSGLVIQFEKE